MPFRLDPDRYGVERAKVQFVTSRSMKAQVHREVLRLGLPSDTRWYQEAACEKLARDTGVDLQTLLDALPTKGGTNQFGHPEREKSEA